MPVRESSQSDDAIRFLADAGGLLLESLDSRRILDSLAHFIVPRFADWCLIDVVQDNVIVRSLFVTSSPEFEDYGNQVVFTESLEPAIGKGTPEVIRTGDPLFLPTVHPGDLAEALAGNALVAAYEAMGVSSFILVPVPGRGSYVAAMHFALFEPGSRYTSSDLLVAQDLARRAGLAIENARHYEDVQRIAGELRKANEARDEFLGLISHELLTPITVIHGGARILRLRGETLEPATRAELVADIETESGRLQRIVENLLTLSRAELSADVSLEPVLLHRVASQLVDSYRAGSAQRTITIEIASEMEPVAADPGFVEQIVRNLLSNADKYSPSDTPIEVRVSSTDGMGLLEVMDRGPGVGDDELEAIFERFYRTADAQQRRSGAGLGLAVCRRLAEAMSARMWASKREGGGLVMSLAIPAYGNGLD